MPLYISLVNHSRICPSALTVSDLTGRTAYELLTGTMIETLFSWVSSSQNGSSRMSFTWYAVSDPAICIFTPSLRKSPERIADQAIRTWALAKGNSGASTLTARVKRPRGFPDWSYLSPSDAVCFRVLPPPPLRPSPPDVSVKTALTSFFRLAIDLGHSFCKSSVPIGTG